MNLTDKQRRFVDEYLVDLNATAAARRAGYSERSARSQGQRLLTKDDIQSAIRDRRAQLHGALEITQERVRQELCAIAFANGTDFVTVTSDGRFLPIPTDAMPEEKRRAVAAIKAGPYGVEIRLHDKVRALELLGKDLGMFLCGALLQTQTSNLLERIRESTGEAMDTDGIPELESPAAAGDELVE